MKMMVNSLFFLSLSMVLMILLLLLSFLKNIKSSSKNSLFECGFSCNSFSGVMFSMPFFLFSLMFLVFDVEIILLCFYPFFLNLMMGVFMFYIIILILLLTLYEWYNGLLSWM